MRLRKPNFEFSQQEEPENKTEMKCVTYDVTTITPIFGGGVEAGVLDEELPIRATAIRGQLRYWWRFLTSHRKENPITDHKNLFEQERKIWGGMGEQGKDYSSKVFVRVHKIQNKNIETYDEQQAGYALFPARSEKKKRIPAKEVIREGLHFNLTITAPSDEFQQIEEVMRWWMTFGGIGARTRRGVGSVNINDLKPIQCDEAKNTKCTLIIKENYEKSSIEAWEKAVGYLQDFRQKSEVGRNKGSGKIPAGRSRWPEPDSLRRILNTYSTKNVITRFNKRENKENPYQCNDHSPIHPAMISFPRAYFGLPIVFQFKDVDCGEPNETQLLPQNSERLASPVILTPYRISNDKYAPAALLLPFDHIDNIQILLTQGDNNVSNMPQGLSHSAQTQWEKENWPNNWWDSSKAQHVKPINDNSDNGKATNPLEAFMKYFEKG